jgi:hypothetical protein
MTDVCDNTPDRIYQVPFGVAADYDEKESLEKLRKWAGK